MAPKLRFRALGSAAHVIVVGGPPSLVEQALRRIDDLERRWSRFLPGSEISDLNRRAGNPVAVSDETVLLVERAVEAWRLTAGSFDPTVLGDVIRAGRPFDDLGPNPPTGRSGLMLGCTDIEVVGREVRLPAGTGFDPGGIGKGLAADIVVAELMAAGAAGACVNLGGDLRVTGLDPTDEAWTIAVEHPLAATPIAHVGLRDGAVATSTGSEHQAVRQAPSTELGSRPAPLPRRGGGRIHGNSHCVDRARQLRRFRFRRHLRTVHQ